MTITKVDYPATHEDFSFCRKHCNSCEKFETTKFAEAQVKSGTLTGAVVSQVLMDDVINVLGLATDPVTVAKKNDEESNTSVKNPVPPVSTSAATSKGPKVTKSVDTVVKPGKKAAKNPKPKRSRLSGAARQRFKHLLKMGVDWNTARVQCKEPIPGFQYSSFTNREHSREDSNDKMGGGSSFNRGLREVVRDPISSYWGRSRSRSNERLHETLDLRDPTYDDSSGQSIDDLSPLQIEEKLRQLDEKELHLDLRRDTLLQSFSTNSKQRRLLNFNRIERRKTRKLRRLERKNFEDDQSRFDNRQQRRDDVSPNRFIEDILFRRDVSVPMRDLSPPNERQNMNFQSDRSFDQRPDGSDMNVQNSRFGPRNMDQERPNGFFGGNNNNNFGPRDSSSFSDMRNNLFQFGQGLGRAGSYQNMNQGGRFNNDNNFGQGPPNQFRGNVMMQQLLQRGMDGPWGGNMMGNSPPKQPFPNQQRMNQGNPNFNPNNGGFWRPYGNNNGGPFGGGPGMQQFLNNNQQQMMNNRFQNPMMGGGPGPGQGQGMMGMFQNNNNMQRGGSGGIQGMVDRQQGYKSHPGRRIFK